MSSWCLARGAEQNRAPQGFILWAGPPLGAQPMWSAMGIRSHTPHKCEAAFHTLWTLLTSAPILAQPDIEKPFDMFSDASGTDLGCVLM